MQKMRNQTVLASAVPLRLQFFAEEKDGTDGTKTADAKADGTDTAAKGEAKTDTKDDGKASGMTAYDEAYVKKLRADMEAEKEAAVKAAKEEAEKLAGMKEEEKAEYEKSQREKALSDREAAITKRELMADARAMLAKNELPDAFVEMVLGADQKKTEENVKSLKSAFDAAVQAQVEKRLVGKTPPAGQGSTNGDSKTALEAEVAKFLD